MQNMSLQTIGLLGVSALGVTPVPAAPHRTTAGEGLCQPCLGGDTIQGMEEVSSWSGVSGWSRYHPHLQKAGQRLPVCPWDSQQRTGF